MTIITQKPVFCVSLLSVLVVGCSASTANSPGSPGQSPTSNREGAAVQLARQIPPLYEVKWKVCGSGLMGNKDTDGCASNAHSKLLLWGPVGQADLLPPRGKFSSPLTDFETRELVIYSKGCFPEYSEPQSQQLFSVDASFPVRKGSKPTVTITPIPLNSQQVHSLLTSKAYSTIQLPGYQACKPSSSG